MNKQQLLAAIREARIDERAFVIDDSVREEAYCLLREGDESWSVSYSERGSFAGRAVFPSFSAAASELLGRLVADSSARERSDVSDRSK
jgi:hypothetical protein